MIVIPGGRFVVIGTWDRTPPPPGATPLRLHPFGSRIYGYGDRPDTQRLLEWIGSHEWTGRRVADVGAGTGIIGIAAALSGAAVTWYEERDEIRGLTEQNIAANHLQADVRGTYPDGDDYDVALINIGDRVPPDVQNANPAVMVIAGEINDAALS